MGPQQHQKAGGSVMGKHSTIRSFLAGLAVLATGLLSVTAGAGAAHATSSPSCADSWAAPVSGSWTDPAMWTNGVPGTGLACITVAGSYSVTLPPDDTYADQLVVGDGTGAGQESLVLPGCGPTTTRNRLFANSLDVAPGGEIDMQQGTSCTGNPASLEAILVNGPVTLAGTFLVEQPQYGGVSNLLVASQVTNTGTITTDSSLFLDSYQSAMTVDNQGVINQTGSTGFGLEVPQTGVTFTNEGSVLGPVTYYFPTAAQLSTTTGSTFANDAGGNIGPGGYVVMGTGTTFLQNAGTMSPQDPDASDGFAELADGSSLDINGSGPAEFNVAGNVSMTGDIQPGQTLNLEAATSNDGTGGCSTVNSAATAAGSFTNNGTISLTSRQSDAACPLATAALTVPAGATISNQGTIQATLPPAAAGASLTISGAVANTGTMSVGSGTQLSVAGSVDNSGTVQLAGPLNVGGDYTQEPSGSTSVAVGSQFGSASVQATSTASLAGTLALSGDGVTPPAGASATLISAASLTGTFATVTGTDAGGGLEYQLGYSASALTATVAAPAPVLTGVSVAPPGASVAAGSTAQLTATGSYSDGSSTDVSSSATWSSSQPAVATVSASGLVTGVKPGTTTITAALGGLTGSATVTVTAPPRAYVVSESGHLTVIDRATSTVITTVTVGGLPDAVTVSPDGSHVYVADATGRLDTIDAATDRVSGQTQVGGVPTAVAVSPDGSTIYAADATGRLDIIDAASGRLRATVALGGLPDAVAVSPDGSTVYVASATGGLSVVDAATRDVTATVSVGGVPDAVTVSPGGSAVYVAAILGQVTVINAATATVAAKIAAGGLPDAVAVSPDGSTLYLACGSGHLAVIDLATGKVTSTTNVAGSPDAVAVSPDGSSVYVTGASSGLLSVIGAATGQVEGTVPVSHGAAGVAVS
jgi:YVTN family beta-propeller protein